MNHNFGRNEIFWEIGNGENPDLIAAIKELNDVEFKDDKGLTYLHVAACNHRPQIVKLLLEKGADPNREDKRGACPILMALGQKDENNPEILRLFLNHGLDLQKVIHGMTVKETILSFEDSELNDVIKEFEMEEIETWNLKIW